MAMEMNKTEKMRQKFADKALDVEQLEEVAGGVVYTGSAEKLADDSRFLNVLLRGRPGQCDRYGDYFAKRSVPEIQRAWASVGVTMLTEGNDVGYYHQINGKTVSPEEAYNYAMKVVGKQLKPSDWYWDKK
jgi:hypothetical protein